eukprot:3426420-Prymnesium_polylepis.1
MTQQMNCNSSDAQFRDAARIAHKLFSKRLLPWRDPDEAIDQTTVPKLLVACLGEKLPPSMRFDANVWKNYKEDMDLRISFAEEGNMYPTDRDFEAAWRNMEKNCNQIRKMV